jgi:hypothetical protein
MPSGMAHRQGRNWQSPPTSRRYRNRNPGRTPAFLAGVLHVQEVLPLDREGSTRLNNKTSTFRFRLSRVAGASERALVSICTEVQPNSVDQFAGSLAGQSPAGLVRDQSYSVTC